MAGDKKKPPPPSRRRERESGTLVRDRVQRPRRYKVMLHNDDYTPMDFVVRLLETVFHMTTSRATAVMRHIHNNGVGVAGVFTHEVAETKVAQVHMAARKNECPLIATVEPEDDPDAES